MFLWLSLKHISVFDCVVGIKMFEKLGKTNDWQLQETSSALEHSCVALQITFYAKHTYNVWPEQKQTFLHFNWISYQHPYLVAGGKKNKKNNSNYENLKPNLMECVIRIFMNFVLLSSDYVDSFDLNVP